MHGVDLAGRVVRRRAQVEDARLVAGGAQLVDDVGADEAGAAGDEDPHGSRSARRRTVVERHAPVVLRHPVGVRQLVAGAHDAVAGLVVDLARRPLDRVEHDVLVEARGHAVGQLEAPRMHRIELLARDARSSRPRSPPSARSGRAPSAAVNSLMRKLRPVHVVVGLAVVAEGARELEQRRRGARRACRPPRSRRSWSRRTSRRRRRPSVPGRRPFQRAPCAWAQSSMQEDALGRGRGRRSRSTSKAMWPPMCTRNAARGPVARALRSKSSNDMHRSSRLQSTNTDRAAGAQVASGVAMNVFDGHSTASPRTPGEVQRGQRAARPARRSRPRQRRSRPPRPPRSAASSRPPTTAGSR